MTTDLLRAGVPVWLLNRRTGQQEEARVVIDLGYSIVVCSETDYILRNAEERPLIGKAYPRGDVRVRE